MATKKKKSNNKVLPLILLPISMLVSGLIKVTIGFIPDLISIIAGYKDYRMFYLGENICQFIGELATIIIVVLCSLCCKGIIKRLYFIGSAFVGSLAYILVAKYNLIYHLMYCIFGSGDDDVAVIVAYIVNALSVSICFVLAVVIAELFFKKLSNYEEASATEGKMKINIKNMLVPFAFIIGAMVLHKGSDIFSEYVVLPAIYDYNVRGVVGCIWDFGIILLLAGVLVGSIFILKDKYRALTCVAAACMGYNLTLWGLFESIDYALNAFLGLPDIVSTITYYVFYITAALISVVLGIVFYILLNRKEMDKKEI